ncbi:MAG: hypothetical protein JSU92_11615 [Deltaproteobacteria bacterium]|nr:MAG: hypothetical protein JSU92_11615 [Deltaproteobacteria bacterium]
MGKENEKKDLSVFGNILGKELCEDSILREFLEDISLYRVREDGTREYKILVIDDVEVEGERRTVSYVSVSGALDIIREAKENKTEYEIEDKLSSWVESLCESPRVEEYVIEPYRERLQRAFRDRGDIVLFVGKEYKGPIGLIGLEELADKWDFGRKKERLMSYIEDVLPRMSNLYKYYAKKQEVERSEPQAETEVREAEQEEVAKKFIPREERADVVVMAHRSSNTKRILGYLSLVIALVVPIVSYSKIPFFRSKSREIYGSVKKGIESRLSEEETGFLREDKEIHAHEAEKFFRSEVKELISKPEKSVIDPDFKDKVDSVCKLLVVCGNLCSDYPQVQKYRDRAVEAIIRVEDLKDSREYRKLPEKRKEDIETLILNIKQTCGIPY